MSGYMRFIPTIFMMGVIFILSHQAGDSFPSGLPENSDKLIHVLIYGILTGTSLYAITPYWKRTPLFYDLGIIIFCLFYGVTDEWHQSFIPLRTASFFDIIADGTGAILAVLANRWLVYSRKLNKNKGNKTNATF